MNGIVKPPSRDKLFTDQELCRVLTWAIAHEHEPYWQDKVFLLRFVLGLGLRVSEIPPLRILEDCRVDGFVLVRRSKTGQPRQVKCSPELRPFYSARLQRLQAEGKTKMFPGVSHPRTLARWIDELMDMAGIEKKTRRGIHGLRHAYATFEIASWRLDWIEVALQLGHSSPATTMHTYAHAIGEYMYEESRENRRPKWWGIALPDKRLKLADTATS